MTNVETNLILQMLKISSWVYVHANEKNNKKRDHQMIAKLLRQKKTAGYVMSESTFGQLAVTVNIMK